MTCFHCVVKVNWLKLASLNFFAPVGWPTAQGVGSFWYYSNAMTISIVTVARICNSVGGGVLFDIPPRCRLRWRVPYAPCIAGQSSVPFPSPHASSQRICQPPPPLLIILRRHAIVVAVGRATDRRNRPTWLNSIHLSSVDLSRARAL